MLTAEWRSKAMKVRDELWERAKDYDASGAFPFDNFQRITEEGLHLVHLSPEYGGLELGYRDTVDLLIEISSGCASTGLVLAMHYYSLGGLRRILNTEQRGMVFSEVAFRGAYVASISDPNLFFADDRQKVQQVTPIAVHKTDAGYELNGVKPSVSGSPFVSFLPVYAYQESAPGTYGITAFLTRLDDPGMRSDESWNYAGMRASQTNNVFLEQVVLPEERRIGREGHGIEDTQDLIYWFRIALCAVYQGIAQRAYQYVKAIAKTKRERLSQKPIAFLPGVQIKLADMKIKLETAYSQLLRCADLADQNLSNGSYTDELYKQTLITKQVVTQSVNEILWLAMQIEGMSSLQRGGVLERLFRDARAATFHPPSDDLLKEVLAKKELGMIAMRKRWL